MPTSSLAAKPARAGTVVWDMHVFFINQLIEGGGEEKEGRLTGVHSNIGLDVKWSVCQGWVVD